VRAGWPRWSRLACWPIAINLAMDATNDLKSAVFQAVYNSLEQRRLRLMAIMLLSLKHGFYLHIMRELDGLGQA
jgi:hypothetical protein